MPDFSHVIVGIGLPYAGQLSVIARSDLPPISDGIPSRSILGGAEIKFFVYF